MLRWEHIVILPGVQMSMLWDGERKLFSCTQLATELPLDYHKRLILEIKPYLTAKIYELEKEKERLDSAYDTSLR